MKLTKISKTELNQTKEVPGLLCCSVDYEIKSAKGKLQFTGPKFERNMWHEVLSFFRWTYQEMRSESQVRLYVNTKLGRWGAWAFPQAARTGMTAEELDVTETPEQAVERFASWGSEPSADWLYFCTVHHHCSAGAFQSGTDERNEENQDGLHITVGKMDSDRHDLHARFYLDGNCFDPDLSLFWPIERELADRLPDHVLDSVARFQMCEKVEVQFLNAWRKNVMEVKSRDLPTRSELASADEFTMRSYEPPAWVRVGMAQRLIEHEFAAARIHEEEYVGALQHLNEDVPSRIIIEACLEHAVSPADLLGELEQQGLHF
ncbi:MAG: hypothetical protein ACXWC8_03930 [Limisphaerales bacterium]